MDLDGRSAHGLDIVTIDAGLITRNEVYFDRRVLLPT